MQSPVVVCCVEDIYSNSFYSGRSHGQSQIIKDLSGQAVTTSSRQGRSCLGASMVYA